MCGSKENQKDLFSTSHQQGTSSHLLGSRTSVHVAVASEDLITNAPSSSFLLAFIVEYDFIWYGLSLWSVCSL